MALTFTPDPTPDSTAKINLASGAYLVMGKLTFSGSYVTGGETLDLTKYVVEGGKLRVVTAMVDVRGNDAEYDLTNKKLKLFSAANTELTAAAYNAAITASPVNAAFLVKCS
jgi:hypothetical protein